MLPARLTIDAIYPVPFNSTVTVNLFLPVSSDLNLRVYNMMGQLVTTIPYGITGEGEQMIPLQIPAVSSGAYFNQATTAGENSSPRKIILLK